MSGTQFRNKLGRIGNTLWVLSLTLLALLGAVSLFLLVLSPSLAWMSFSRIYSVRTTRQAHEYHPEVELAAEEVTQHCRDKLLFLNESTYTYDQDLVDCQLEESLYYLGALYTYESDWELGYFDKRVNLITSHRNKGDCEDWSLTYCSLLTHMDLSCIVMSTGTHSVVAAKDGWSRWRVFDPQNSLRLGLSEQHFRGWLV